MQEMLSELERSSIQCVTRASEIPTTPSFFDCHSLTNVMICTREGEERVKFDSKNTRKMGRRGHAMKTSGDRRAYLFAVHDVPETVAGDQHKLLAPVQVELADIRVTDDPLLQLLIANGPGY